jgi:uncharacterized protein YcbK (DUF882 family)
VRKNVHDSLLTAESGNSKGISVAEGKTAARNSSHASVQNSNFFERNGKENCRNFYQKEKRGTRTQKQKKNKQDNYVQLKQLGDNCKETEKQKTANKKIEYN